MQDKVLLIWLLGTGTLWFAWVAAMLVYRKWLPLIAACTGPALGLAFGLAIVSAMNLSRGDVEAVVPRVIWLGTTIGILVSLCLFIAGLCSRRRGIPRNSR